MKTVNVKLVLLLLSNLLLTSCSVLDTQQLHDNTRHINVISNYEQINDCQYIRELVGSEGHWYSFFFISNTELTLASINDLKNQASDVGANTVYVEEHMGFGTSVTFLGQAYLCPAL
ncbi:DUF4156 domain-containing protein [Colwellia psychrerythraea]|uniref:Lipoprotein n=1 Tax=Colwellia psychrerythraea TaxID=28229 RepID=A0A099KU01_COLPS|nr:DUF4156 domain-containing protein [Colwellia psychrerythraea]KGJ93645.1 Protein of unknown function DUF4156 [Colwellia psychrerythraea]